MRKSWAGQGRSYRHAVGTRSKRLTAEGLERRTLLSIAVLPGITQDLASATGPDVADPVRNVAYVVDKGNNRIVAINTDTGNTVGFCAPAANVTGLAVSTDDTRLFAAEPTAFQVEVFSLPSMALVKTLSLGLAETQVVATVNDQLIGTSTTIDVFDAQTGAHLESFPNQGNGELRVNKAGTILYNRSRQQYFNDSSIFPYDVSGTGAPVALTKIPGPSGANSTDFIADGPGGKAYMTDSGRAGVQVTLISSGAQTNWPFNGGGNGSAIAELEAGPYVYAMTTSGKVQQFNQSGVVLGNINLPHGGNTDSLVITPNGHLLYTYSTGVGVINFSTLNITEKPHLAFQTPPANGLVGKVMSPVVVNIEDPANNVITSDNTFVTIAVASGPGMISGTVAEAAHNGVATFSDLALDTSGSYTFVTADGAYGQATSSPFTMSQPHLAFLQQPGKSSAGQAISPAVTVEILDPNNNVITSDNSAVTVSLASGTGTLAGTLTVAAQNGIATFSNLSIASAGTFTLSAADGSDVAATSSSFSVIVPHLLFLQQPSDAIAGAAISPVVTVEILDQNNNVITTDNSAVTLSLASGMGTLNGTLTVAAQNGVAAFNGLTVSGGGSHVLHAADASYTAATSASFTITALHLAFTQEPGDVTAGAVMTPAVAVEIEDENNTLVSNANLNVTLAIGAGPSSAVNGTLTVPAANGVALFSDLSLDLAGEYTLAASDGRDTSALSTTFNVNPAAPVKLAFVQQPTDVLATQAINPAVIVNVEDQFNNLVSSDQTPITLAIASGPAGAVLQGTTTAPAQNDTATFADLSLTQGGTYSLTASAPSLASATSVEFVVVAAPASPLVPAFGGVTLAPAVVAGSKLKGKAPIIVTNHGAAFQGNVTVNFYADTTPGLDGNQTLLTTLTKKLSLKPGASKTLSGNFQALPVSLPDGNYYIVAQIVDPSGAKSTAATPRQMQVAGPFVQPALTAGAVAPSTVVIGKSAAIAVTVANTGNVPATGVTVTLSPSSDGTTPLPGVVLASIRSGAKIQPGKSKTFKLHFKVPSTLAAGNYFPALSVSLGGVPAAVIGTTGFVVG